MLFATPKFFLQAIRAAHKLGWKPQVYIASVSIEPTIMGIARFNAPELTKGALSIAFVKNPNDPIWAKDKAVALYRSIMRKYNPSGKPTDVYNWYGMTVAWTMVETLRKAGKNLTRAGLLQGRAEPRHRREPVPAPRDPPEDVADGLPADGAGVPLPLRQQAVGEGERDPPGEGMTAAAAVTTTRAHRTRRADEETNLDRRRRTRSGRGAHRGTCRDGRVHVAEARGHADGDRRRRQGVARSERRPDGRACGSSRRPGRSSRRPRRRARCSDP